MLHKRADSSTFDCLARKKAKRARDLRLRVPLFWLADATANRRPLGRPTRDRSYGTLLEFRGTARRPVCELYWLEAGLPGERISSPSARQPLGRGPRPCCSASSTSESSNKIARTSASDALSARVARRRAVSPSLNRATLRISSSRIAVRQVANVWALQSA